MLQTMLDAQGWKKLTEQLQLPADIDKLLAPLPGLLTNLTGQLGIAGTWSSTGGFGLLALAETPGADKATMLVSQVTEAIKLVTPQFPVTVNNGISSLPDLPLNDALHATFCWIAQDACFKCASDPRWLTGPAQTMLQLPQDAVGKDSVVLADLAFLTPYLTQQETTHGKSAWIDTLRSMELAKLKIVGYSSISDDGASSNGVMEIQHFSGKGMVDDVTQLVTRLTAPATIDNTAIKDQQAASKTNLRQFAKNIQLWSHDNGEILPPIKTPADIKIIFGDDKVFQQPSSKQPYMFNVKLAGQPLAKYVGKEADTLLLYEQTPYADGSRCATFLDGHVEVYSAETWEDAKVKLGI